MTVRLGLTTAQVRALADALSAKRLRLGLSLRQAASAAGVPLTTYFRGEAADERLSAHTVNALQTWLLTPEGTQEQAA